MINAGVGAVLLVLVIVLVDVDVLLVVLVVEVEVEAVVVEVLVDVDALLEVPLEADIGQLVVSAVVDNCAVAAAVVVEAEFDI